MKRKMLSLMFVLATCASLLGGCRLSVQPPPGLSSFLYENAEQYTMGGASLTDIVESVEIRWVSGGVSVECGQENTVVFEEDANRDLDADSTMYYWLEGTTLHIQYCRSGEWDFSGLEKDLVLRLPAGLRLKELDINGVSAGISVDSVSSAALEISTVTGSIYAKNCAVSERADFDTTSGKISADLREPLKTLKAGTVSGRIDITANAINLIDMDSTSGSVTVSVQSAPKSMELDTVSGSLTLCLPENADFTLHFDTVSGSFSSDLLYKTEHREYIFGNGAGAYNIGTTSGNVTIQVTEEMGGTE